jgi:hypothetical protein
MKNLNAGDLTVCMCVGHVVDARVIRVLTKADGINAQCYQYEMEFLAHHDSGDRKLCLDFGQQWNISEGETFLASDANVNAAWKWINKAADAV